MNPLRLVRCAVALAALTAVASCRSERASEADCREILDRMVAIELRDQGYDDDALYQRKRAEMAVRFETDLRTCVGRPMPPHAMDCVRGAETIDDVSHHCLKR